MFWRSKLTWNCVCVLNKWCYLAGFTKLIQISLTGTRWRYATVMVHPLLVTQKVRLALVYHYLASPVDGSVCFISRFKWGILPCYIWIYLMWVFFFLFPKTLNIYSRKEVGCSSEARSYGKLLWMNSYQLACRKQNRLYSYFNPL